MVEESLRAASPASTAAAAPASAAAATKAAKVNNRATSSWATSATCPRHQEAGVAESRWAIELFGMEIWAFAKPQGPNSIEY